MFKQMKSTLGAVLVVIPLTHPSAYSKEYGPVVHVLIVENIGKVDHRFPVGVSMVVPATALSYYSG